MTLQSFIITLFLATFPLLTCSLQCISDTGKNVDWLFVYKVNDGLSYVYYDASNTAKTFTIVNGKSLGDQDSAIGNTLNVLWKNPTKYNFIAYNDEPPDGSSGESYGHTKGVFAYDSAAQTGFFLIHSWPKFPNFAGSSYNVNGASITYAQTYLCISYKTYDTFNSIAYQLRYNKPKVYNSSNTFPSGTTNNFIEILDKKWLDYSNTFQFNSINNAQSFTHFAKSANWDNDLYEYLVSPYYKQSFIWETWRRSPAEPSYCQPQYKYNEENVESVTVDGKYWKYTQDHGKSGCSIISNSNDKPLVCVGDINRMSSQQTRGGGTCCLEHQNLYDAFNTAFKDHDLCNSTAHHSHLFNL